MSPMEQIEVHISSLSEPKRSEIQIVHDLILSVNPKCRLWFEDGRNRENMIVTNPTIGYGNHLMSYSPKNKREVFQIALSAVKTGISLYIIAVKDKSYLSKNFDGRLGKASITGYCVRFRHLKDIDINVLKEIIQYGFGPAQTEIIPLQT